MDRSGNRNLVECSLQRGETELLHEFSLVQSESTALERSPSILGQARCRCGHLGRIAVAKVKGGAGGIGTVAFWEEQ